MRLCLLLLVTVLLPATTTVAYEFVGYINGPAAGDQYGSAITTVDFNADGYPDLAVAAPAADDAGVSSGRVSIYYGGPAADTIADLTLNGPASSFFGQSLASAGDFNADGYEDLLVGAPFYDDPAVSAGGALLFYGGPSPDTAVDHIFTGEAGSDYYGISVAGVGDFNNDTFDDIVVGAYRADYGAFNGAGKAYVYYGGSSPDFTVDRVLVGEADGERFGYAVTGADLNGDNFADIAVGAYSYDDAELNQGRIYVFYGGSAPDTLFDMAITGDSAGYKFGWSLTTGLVDNDLSPDLIMGSDGVSIDTFSTGKVYVFDGGTGFDGVADDFYWLNRQANDYLGISIASGVDLNADGSDEIIAGMPGNDDAGVDAGGAVVLNGGSAISEDTALFGSEASEEAGQGVGLWSWYGSASTYAVVTGAPSWNSFTGRLAVYRLGSAPENQPPVLDPVGDKFTAFGSLLEFTVTAADPDGTIPDLTATGVPAGASFVDNNDGTGSFAWTPAESDTGTYEVTFIASDGELADSSLSTITVVDTANCCDLRGDVNESGGVNVSDLTYLVDFLFRGGPAPPCPAEGDVNMSGAVNVSDLTYLVDYLFRGGPAPLPCP